MIVPLFLWQTGEAVNKLMTFMNSMSWLRETGAGVRKADIMMNFRKTTLAAALMLSSVLPSLAHAQTSPSAATSQQQASQQAVQPQQQPNQAQIGAAVNERVNGSLIKCVSEHHEDAPLYCIPSPSQESFAHPVMPHQLMGQKSRPVAAWRHNDASGARAKGAFVLLQDGSLGWLDAAMFNSSADLVTFLDHTGTFVGHDMGEPKTGTPVLGRVISLMAFLVELMFVLILGMQVLPMFRSPLKRYHARDMKTFADIAGNGVIKKELSEIVSGLRPNASPELAELVPNAILLEGPPGNAKTLMACAFAGELKVPFYAINGSDIIEMYAGLGSRRVRRIYRRLRRHLRGAVLFIDEFDTIAHARSSSGPSDGASSEHDQVVAAILNELDGLQHKRSPRGIFRFLRPRGGRVITIAATNRADILDPAIVRTGRFDRKVHVPNPDLQTIREIFEIQVRGLKIGKSVDFHVLSRMMLGKAGSDITFLVRQARLIARREQKQVITMAHFEEAVDIALMGDKSPGYHLSESDRMAVAYHEAGHAIVALRTPGNMEVRKITIVPRAKSLGMVVLLPNGEQVMQTRQSLTANIMTSLGGRASEELMMGPENVGSGAAQDISHATQTLRMMGSRLGMFDGTIGMVELTDKFGRMNVSPEMQARLDDEVSLRMGRLYRDTLNLLSREKENIEALANVLLDEETISGERALSIIGEGPMVDVDAEEIHTNFGELEDDHNA